MYELDGLVRRQHGLATTKQLEDSGMSVHQVRHALSIGRLIRVRPGVYRFAGTAVTKEQAWLAAVLAAGANHLLSHESAARLHRLLGFFDPVGIDLLVHNACPTRLDGVRGHRTLFLPPSHGTRVSHIPVTTPARTLVDACNTVPFGVLESSIDDALRRRLLKVDDLVRAVAVVPMAGRRKTEPIRRALGERAPGFHPGESPPEVNVLKVLRRSSYPEPVPQYEVSVEGRTYRLDFAWPVTLHALEYEGLAFHGPGNASAFHADRARTRALQRAGWTVWPITSRTSRSELLAIAEVATSAAPAQQVA